MPASGVRAPVVQRSDGGRLSEPGVGLPVFAGALSASLPELCWGGVPEVSVPAEFDVPVWPPRMPGFAWRRSSALITPSWLVSSARRSRSLAERTAPSAGSAEAALGDPQPSAGGTAPARLCTSTSECSMRCTGQRSAISIRR